MKSVGILFLLDVCSRQYNLFCRSVIRSYCCFYEYIMFERLKFRYLGQELSKSLFVSVSVPIEMPVVVH